MTWLRLSSARGLPRTRVRFSGCKIADRSLVSLCERGGWPADRYLVSAFPLSDASDSPVIRLCVLYHSPPSRLRNHHLSPRLKTTDKTTGLPQLRKKVDRIRHRADRMNKDEKEAREQEIGEFPNKDHGPTTPPPNLGTIILQLATILERLQPLHLRDLDLDAFDEYFRTKATLGIQLNLPRPVIIEALTEGLPTGDQRLVRVVPPKSLSEWYELTSRVRGNFSPQPPRCSDNPTRMEGPYHNTPRPPPRTQNYAAMPPSSCKFCQEQHWHSQCQQRPASNAQHGQTYHASHNRQGLQTTPSTAPAAPTTSNTSPKQITDARTELSHPDFPTQFNLLLHHYQHIFSENKFDVPTLNIPPVKINTTSDKMITLRPYRVPYCDLKEIQNQVAEILKHNIIEKSYSPFASTVTLLTKRDKTKHVHPLPLIDSVLDKLSRAKIFSSADIASAYWQVEIAPESRPLLAFVTPDGQYQ
ncbi:hypothetical protein LAZ67_7001644 [Cordylochernes scorpioides]|uniref:Reverse transcriptase domain-containing protein n=1 Tax=Cordylochernes scorpioides TaxID=51811 RepID=A0ABY6KMG7_9ARAC|nr:hypothetical protein LAZ67_7001644 [Cordylochernes scorpioides]